MPRHISDLGILGSKFRRRFLKVVDRDPRAGRPQVKVRARTLPGLELLEGRMMLAIFTVTSTGDSPNFPQGATGTLRWAINLVDSSTDLNNAIEFDFASVAPGASHTIILSSALPAITNQVDIEGNSQPGFSAAPLIAITCSSEGFNENGLTLGAGSAGSKIENLAISGFSLGYGIDISSWNNTVDGCYIGTDITGGTAEGNAAGIGVEPDTSGNTIGGTSANAGNVISANSRAGIEIYGSCLVEGNRIGTNADGTAVFQNSGVAVQVSGIIVAASNVTIGGTSLGTMNVISGNVAGIQFFDNAPNGIVPNASCLVEGNRIGTTADGTAGFRTKAGIFVQTNGIEIVGSGATIGGTSAEAANTISGNADGMEIYGACVVEGNRIGTNAAMTDSVPNTFGIIVNEPGATVGGTSLGAANMISGNFDGIYINASCLVEGNLIGTNATGTTGFPNTGDVQSVGIDVEASGATIGGTSLAAANTICSNKSEGINIQASCLVEGNGIGTDAKGDGAVPNAGDGILVGQPGATIGGTSAGAGNVISGNGGSGIEVFALCLVEGNRIGTNADGTGGVQNSIGIHVDQFTSVATIGGTSAAAANVISGNSSYGIELEVPCLVEGNLIGTNATGTAAVQTAAGAPQNIGIGVEGPGATIGGTAGSAANIISGNKQGIDMEASCLLEGNRIGTDPTGVNPVPNQGIGVYVDDGSGVAITIGGTDAGNVIAFNGGPGVATAPGTTESSIQFNAIFSNGGPGIDLNDDGVTPNTPDGANNTPILTSAAGGSVSGTLNASPNTFYIVDFYANLTSDGSAARPQGRDYLTSTFVETNAAGDALFNLSYTPMPGMPILTATTTDTEGTTSEFSPPVREVTSLGGVLTPFAHSVEFVAGTPFSRVVASFADTDPRAFSGQFTAMIDWGDSTAETVGVVSADGAGFDVTGSHSYNVAKTDPITVTITDAVTGATVIANSTALVDPVPITIQTKNFAVTGGANFSGTVATFTDGDARTSSAFYTATINWGDNTFPTTGMVTGTNPFTVTASHTFATFQNTDIVTITITDKNGRTATGYDRVVDPPVAANPVSTPTTNPTTPQAPASSPAPAVLAMVAESLALAPNKPFAGTVATFTDSGPAEAASAYKAIINWGKGRKSAGMIAGSNGRFVVSARHEFPRFAGTKTVTITVTYPEGQVVSVSEPASYAVRRPKALKRMKSAAKRQG